MFEKFNRKRRGAALLLALITLFVILGLGLAMSSMTITNLKQTKGVQNRTLAFNLAEAGVDRGIRVLKDPPYGGAPPANTGTFSLTGLVGAQALGGGTYTVTCTADPANPGLVLKKYTITSVGKYLGYTETVSVYIRQQSFGKYAYFTDAEVSSISGGAIWFYSGDKIRGPAHSNNSNSSNFQIDWTTSTVPIFEGMVTSVATSMTYTPKTPSKEADYEKIYKTGSKGYQLNVDKINLPSSTSKQYDAALGTGTAPTVDGVYVEPNGGIFIRGDNKIVAAVDSGSNQKFTITVASTGSVYTVIVAGDGSYTSIQKGSGSVVKTMGASTGVLYSTGNVTALSGEMVDNQVSGGTVTHRNAFTLCTDVLNGKNITINNTLKYKTQYDPAQATTSDQNLKAGCLGLIARNVIVDSTAPTSMQIDALILAGSSSTSDGSFYVSNYNTKNPTGTLKVTGGIIQKARGPVGTLNSGSLATGYAKDYYYDSRLADNPPPYFPTTGAYDRVSWVRKGQ